MSKEDFVKHMEEVLKRMPDRAWTADLEDGLLRYKQDRMSQQDEGLLREKIRVTGIIEEAQKKIEEIDAEIVSRYGKKAIIEPEIKAVADHLKAVKEASTR